MKKFIATILLFLIILSTTAQSARAEGLLSDFFEMIKNWFESSPLGNIFSMPVKRIESIELSFYPQSFDLVAEDFINITTNESEISNFKGTMNINMENKILILKEEGSTLSIKKRIGVIKLGSLKLSSLELNDMKLVLTSGNWNETTENGSVTIMDFLGSVTIKDGVMDMKGNVSKIIKG